MVETGVPFIKPLYSCKILPTVYEDSLSYSEQICKMIAKLNELIEYVNNVELNILDQAKAYTDAKIQESLADINQLIYETKIEFERILAQQKEDYEELEDYVRIRLTAFDNRLNQYAHDLESAIIGCNAYTDLAIQQNNEYIFEEIAKGVINLKVLNYFTGEYVTVQEMFDYLAQFHLQNAISYGQLVASELTYNELIALDETYTNWAVNGYNIVNP